MYSRNDYRYYLEHRCAESDDFLMHYGVKGMKWKDHKYAGVTGWASTTGHKLYLGLRKAKHDLHTKVADTKHEIAKYRGSKRIKKHTDLLKKELHKSANYQKKPIDKVRKKVAKTQAQYEKQAKARKRKLRKAYGLNKKDFQRPAKRAEMKKAIIKKLNKPKSIGAKRKKRR